VHPSITLKVLPSPQPRSQPQMHKDREYVDNAEWSVGIKKASAWRNGVPDRWVLALSATGEVR